MENQRIISAAIVGGLTAAVISTTPILNLTNCICCIGIIAGGAVGLFYYARMSPAPEFITPPVAVTLGIVTGLFGAFFATGLEWVFFKIFGPWQIEFANSLMEKMDEVPVFLQEMLDDVETQMAKGFNWGSVLLENLIVLPVFCLVGALIARVFINKKVSESG